MPNIKKTIMFPIIFCAMVLIPEIAFASSKEDFYFMLGAGVVAFLLWWLSIALCRMGGGWILLGVLIGIFIALPVTGYAVLGYLVVSL